MQKVKSLRSAIVGRSDTVSGETSTVLCNRKGIALFGPVTTRGERPPADIENDAAEHLAKVNRDSIPAERVTTIGQFVESVYLPWVEEHKRPSTAKSYRDIWQGHLKGECADVWMKNVRTFNVQAWLNSIAKKGLSHNTLKDVKSALSAIFKVGK